MSCRQAKCHLLRKAGKACEKAEQAKVAAVGRCMRIPSFCYHCYHCHQCYHRCVSMCKHCCADVKHRLKRNKGAFVSIKPLQHLAVWRDTMACMNAGRFFRHMQACALLQYMYTGKSTS